MRAGLRIRRITGKVENDTEPFENNYTKDSVLHDMMWTLHLSSLRAIFNQENMFFS